MKISIVLAQAGKPTLTFDCTVAIDPKGTKHPITMSKEDTALYLSRTSSKHGDSVWHRGGNFGTITDGKKVVMCGYVVRNKEDTGYFIREDSFHTSLWRLWHTSRDHDFWWQLSYRTGWDKVSGFFQRFYRRWIVYPVGRVTRFLSGLPNWWIRFTQDEPPCPHCGGTGISYGDPLDEHAEYPCHYCDGKKRMRKCTCNRFGLYPIWGRRFRVRENCPSCGKTSDRGWLKIK